MHTSYLSQSDYSYQSDRSSEKVDLAHDPTYVILDLGCTRAMGSRVAANRFMKAAPYYGITIESLPTDSKFNFANSQTSVCKERMRVWLPMSPPISTDFDIVEEGNVPLLLSLPQMRNLRFTIELSPEAVYIKSPAFGNKRVQMKSSTSNHIVLDLCNIEGLPRNLSRLITNPDTNLNYPSFL